jgi:hypothetical protein
MPCPRGAVAAAVLLLSGCVEAIALGTQCPGALDCVGDGPSPDSPGKPGSPLTAIDGAVVGPNGIDGGQQRPDDAGDLSDAAAAGPVPSGAPVVFPGLENGSFSVTRGGFGNLAYSPIEPIPLGVNLAEPWSACGFQVSVLASAESMRNSGTFDVLPTDGSGFVEANVGVPALQGLRQNPPVPIKQGVRYGFSIDVRAAVGADVTLELWGSFVDCVEGVKLADVGKLPEQWTRMCVSFESRTDLPQLLLKPSARGFGNGDSRVFFDNIRAVRSCP